METRDRDFHILKAKQAEALNKAKTRFVANVSHELRTPLHGTYISFLTLKGIIGMATNLKDSPLLKEQREFVDIILSSASALVAVTNDILDMARIEQVPCPTYEFFSLRYRKEKILSSWKLNRTILGVSWKMSSMLSLPKHCSKEFTWPTMFHPISRGTTIFTNLLWKNVVGGRYENSASVTEPGEQRC